MDLRLVARPCYLSPAHGHARGQSVPAGHHSGRPGTAANGIAIVANGGWMPVWQPSLAAAGFDPSALHSNFYRMLVGPGRPRFSSPVDGPLVDIIPIPIPIAPVGRVDRRRSARCGTGLLRLRGDGPSAGPGLDPGPGGAAAGRGGRSGRRAQASIRCDWPPTAPSRPMWLGQVVSSLGDRVHQVALVYLVARATDSSPLALGLSLRRHDAPNRHRGPARGALVDRWTGSG